MVHFDVVIAGGGIAGSSTAAALAQKGLRVLLCEAGLPDERRLAGELMHPPALANLERLGLISPRLRAGSVPSYGFVLSRGASDPGTVLSYSEVPGGSPFGLAAEHAFLVRELLRSSARVPGVELWEGARVVQVAFGHPNTQVRIVRDGADEEVRCRLVVSAEGRASKLRERAGIITERRDTFRMIGWRIPDARLPLPGYGHIFLGGPGTALAYGIGTNEARVMFEIGLGDAPLVAADTLSSLPQPLRDQVREAMGREKGCIAKVVTLAPNHAVSDGFAVVGDAGGCSHPITASGISSCINDAVLLADTLAASRSEARTHPLDNLARGLAAYQRKRQRGVRTRVVLATALRDALYDPHPDMLLLRSALFEYWRRSTRGRQASIGLLTTHRTAMSSLVREYAQVSFRALQGLRHGVLPVEEIVPALAGIARRNVRYLAAALPLHTAAAPRWRPRTRHVAGVETPDPPNVDKRPPPP